MPVVPRLPRSLSAKQRSFIDHYLICRNASEAARRAGYSPPTAYAMGAENLRKPAIAAEIDRRLRVVAAALSEAAREGLEASRGQLLRKVRPRERGVVYFVRAENGLVKIGKTVDWNGRLQRLNTMLPYDLEVIRLIECSDYATREAAYHRRFASQRVRGEWFRLTEADLASL